MARGSNVHMGKDCCSLGDVTGEVECRSVCWKARGSWSELVKQDAVQNGG